MCGGVRYEVHAPLVAAGYCHCKRCQRRSGAAASPQGRVEPGSFRIVSGEELVKLYRPEDGFEKAFCSGCGSALFSRDPDDPSIISVRLGTFDEDPGIRPSTRQWLDRAAAWEEIPDDGIARYPGARPPGT
jgi:hypothetical protein